MTIHIKLNKSHILLITKQSKAPPTPPRSQPYPITKHKIPILGASSHCLNGFIGRSALISLSLSLSPSLHTHTLTSTFTADVYIYIYMCVCERGTRHGGQGGC